ncbi:MAG TPA: carboxypeptidase regulatory-like domain-containing protein [Ideonella sp.]|nr:carboxypeptidase regulatory-like domain-containing protein [Ideonella sp.]
MRTALLLAGRRAAAMIGLACATAAAPALAYEAGPVSGGGRIEGRVSFLGNVPVKKIIPTKDREVCGGARDEPQIRVGADKGVQDAVIYLKGIEKGKAWGPVDKAPVLDQEKCVFKPAVQVVRAGKIDIVNSDPVLHNTHGFYGQRTAFNLALPDKGMKIASELPRPGLVRVECDAHGWMLAHVYVADSPYYALTGSDGSFSLADVPPGTYTLVATQYYAGDTEVQVTVKAGEAAKLNIELKKK